MSKLSFLKSKKFQKITKMTLSTTAAIAAPLAIFATINKHSGQPQDSVISATYEKQAQTRMESITTGTVDIKPANARSIDLTKSKMAFQPSPTNSSIATPFNNSDYPNSTSPFNGYERYKLIDFFLKRRTSRAPSAIADPNQSLPEYVSIRRFLYLDSGLNTGSVGFKTFSVTFQNVTFRAQITRYSTALYVVFSEFSSANGSNSTNDVHLIYDNYEIDSVAPSAIDLANKDLLSLSAVGNTKDLTINGQTDLINSVISDNAIYPTMTGDVSTQDFINRNVNLLYAIDKKDGTFLAGDIASPDGLWLLEDHIKKYLSGGLVISNGKVVYDNDSSKEVAAFTSDVISARRTAGLVQTINGKEYILPNYKTLDVIVGRTGNSSANVNAQGSLLVKWASVDQNYVAKADDFKHTLINVATPIARVPFSFIGLTSFTKWVNGKELNDGIRNLVVVGSTKDASAWDFQNTTDATAQAIANIGSNIEFDFQYSYGVAGSTTTLWQTNKPDFANQSWAVRNARQISGRFVPKGLATNQNASGLVSAGGLTIDYTGEVNQVSGATFNTTTRDAQNVFLFRTYLNLATGTNLKSFVVGNQIKVTDVIEDGVDNNADDYSQATLLYLYRGSWYDKGQLISKIDQDRNASIASSSLAKNWVAPTDFQQGSISLRFKVDTPDTYVVESASTVAASDGTSTNWTVGASRVMTSTQNTRFKNFNSIWDIQDQVTNDFRFDLANSTNNKTGQDAVLELVGSADSLSAKFLSAGITNFSTRNITFEWSLAATPSESLTSSDWQRPQTLASGNFFENVGLDPINKYLWIRFIPTRLTDSLSNFSNFGILDNANPNTLVKAIRVDTSKIKTNISAQANPLKSVVVSGTTSWNATNNTGLSIDLTPFVEPQLNATTGKYAFSAIDNVFYYDASGNKVTIETEQGLRDWFNNVGLYIRFQVKATRTKGAYVKDTSYIFNSLSDLRSALSNGDLNFNRSSLELGWNINVNKQDLYTVDQTFVKPDDVASLINIIYSEDIYNLTTNTIVVSGNDIKVDSVAISTTEVDATLSNVKATDALNKNGLGALGLKLEYNWFASSSNASLPDDTKWTEAVPTTGINANKDFWIRLAPIVATDTQLASIKYAGNPNQLTKLDLSKTIKIAIPFKDHNSTDSVLDKFNAAEISGKTYDFNWTNVGQSTAKDLPKLYTSIDNVMHGFVQYSRDNTNWFDSIERMLENRDYYQTNINSFQKEQDSFYVRFVYKNAQNQPLLVSDEYVYTDANGDQINNLNLLSREISIDNLIQPILIDKSLALLTGQTSISPTGLTSPTGSNNFASTTWRELANFNGFSPKFVINATDVNTVDFVGFHYNELLLDASGEYIFGMGKNPFDGSQDTRDDFNALLPRNTYLQYRYRASETDPWSTWQDTPPTNIAKSSNFVGFEARLVAVDGYELPSTDFITSSTYALDGSPREANKSFSSDQNWSNQYKIEVKLQTSNINLPIDPKDQAEFIGWNDLSAPKGMFKTVDTSGNHAPSNDPDPVLQKDIIIGFSNSINNTPFDVKAEKTYVLEFNVKNNGAEIEWTDSRSLRKSGWHTAIANVLDAPGFDVPWYGAYPVSLKNGDIVEVRLRARSGFVISGDINSTDFDANSRTSRWSHTMTFAPISTLTSEIVLPSSFKIYDRVYSFDYYNALITVDQTMPYVSFQGNDAAGGLLFFDDIVNQPSYEFDIAILNPMEGVPPIAGDELFDPYQRPKYGYTTIENVSGNRIPIYYASSFNSNVPGWIVDWEKKVTWIDAKNVKTLRVGDAIVLRPRAKAGFGFKWDDATNNYDDLLYPKQVAEKPYGTADLSPKPSYIPEDLNFLANNGVVPIPVRGLKLVPEYNSSQLSLKYSSIVQESLNNANSKVEIDPTFLPPAGSKWRWVYRLTRNGSLDPQWVARIPLGMLNGDVIEARADAINTSYTLDTSYNNVLTRFVVSGLKVPLNANGIPRPILEIDGYENHGAIVRLTQHIPDASYSASLWSRPDSTYPFGRPILTQENNVPSRLVWEFQVIDRSPSDYSNLELEQVPWVKTAPNNLKVGQYIRVRAGTVSANDLALVNNLEPLYSYAPIFDSANPTLDTNPEGWVKVTNLYLDVNKIDVLTKVQGFNGRTFVSGEFTNKSIDESHVSIEVSIDSGVTWISLNDDKLKVIRNGDSLQVRVFANEGYRFNLIDIAPGLDIYQDSTTKIYYLHKQKWDLPSINYLKEYLEVKDVVFDPKQIILQKMPNSPTGPSINPTDLIDGFVTILPVSFIGKDTIVDLNGNNKNPEGTPFGDVVKVHYLLQTLDPQTGLKNPEIILPEGVLPSQLSNGDHVIAELYSIDPRYQLSQNKRIDIFVRDLIVLITRPVSDPVLTFTGTINSGTVLVSPSAPLRTKWTYTVVRAGSQLPPLPLSQTYIDDPQNWSDNPPVDLKNGDYVIVMLKSIFPNAQINVENTSRPGETPMNTNWVLVSGLKGRIDLSYLKFNNLFDYNNPFNPNKDVSPNAPLNYAFRLVGKQEGVAKLEINAPIYSKNSDRLVDSNGNYIPDAIAQKLEWEFMINDSANNSQGIYSPTPPTELKNGQYIHVRLRSINSEEYEIVGFDDHYILVSDLDAAPSISAKTLILVVSIVGGVLAIAIVAGTSFYAISRKKSMSFLDN